MSAHDVARRVDEAVRRWRRVHRPRLDSAEAMVADEFATRRSGIRRGPGRLYLTPERLIYRAARRPLVPIPLFDYSVEVPVREIISVGVAPLPTYLGLRFNEEWELAVATQRHHRHFFRTPAAWSLAGRLNEARLAAGAIDVPWPDLGEPRGVEYVPMVTLEA